jgi:hypothetical protein
MAWLSHIVNAAQHLIRDTRWGIAGGFRISPVPDSKPADNDAISFGSRTSGVPPDPRAFFGARETSVQMNATRQCSPISGVSARTACPGVGRSAEVMTSDGRSLMWHRLARDPDPDVRGEPRRIANRRNENAANTGFRSRETEAPDGSPVTIEMTDRA